MVSSPAWFTGILKPSGASGEIGEDVVMRSREHIGCGRAEDLHEQERRTLGEDGSKLRLAHAALFFQDGRVGGDAFEDAQRLVAGNGGRIGAVEVHDEAPVRGGGGIIKVAFFRCQRRARLSQNQSVRLNTPLPRQFAIVIIF